MIEPEGATGDPVKRADRRQGRWWLALCVLALALILSQIGSFRSSSPYVVEEIPRIPQSLLTQARPYYFRGAVLLDWHPKRLEMLVRTLYDRAGHIQEVLLPGGTRYRLTRFTDSVSGVSYHPKQGDYFIFSMDHDGRELYQKYRYDLRTYHITLLTDGRSRNSPGVWSKSGDQLAYLSDRQNGRDQDLYAMNPLQPASDRLLTRLGVALLFPNVRGSSGYGKTFLKLDNGFHRVDAYRDIGALLDWIKTRPELDADRVMVTGASYGGHMALAVATMYSDRIRCTVDISGPSDLVTAIEGSKNYRDLHRAEYGDERDPKMRAFLERIAPLNNARKITKPLFIVQGANDPRVPLREAEQMRAAVKKNGTPVWYLIAQNEGHSFQQPQSRYQLWYALVLFTEKYLLS